MEGTQVLSVAFLHNFEPESGKVCSERRWIVSPGGSENVIAAPSAGEVEITRFVKVNVKRRQIKPLKMRPP